MANTKTLFVTLLPFVLLAILTTSAKSQETGTTDAKNKKFSPRVRELLDIAFVQSIDDYLSLRDNQREQIRTFCHGKIEDQKLEEFHLALQDVPSFFPLHPFKELGVDEDFMKLLLPSQIQFWKKMNALTEPEPQDPLQTMIDLSNSLVQLRVERMTEEFDLSQTQARKIEFAGKLGAKESLIAWEQQDMSIHDVVAYRYRPMLLNSLGHKLWKGTLRANLSPTQLNAIATAKARYNPAHQARFAVFICYRLKLDFETDIERLCELIEDEIDVRPIECFENLRELLAVDQDKIEAMIQDQERWKNTIEPHIAEARRLLNGL